MHTNPFMYADSQMPSFYTTCIYATCIIQDMAFGFVTAWFVHNNRNDECLASWYDNEKQVFNYHMSNIMTIGTESQCVN